MRDTDGSGAERALATLLQANGVRVRFRVAVPGSASDASEELGLATPGFEDVEVGRGALRADSTLLVGSGALAHACGSRDGTTVAALFASACGVLVDDEYRAVDAWRVLRAGDDVYGYEITLTAR